MPRVLETAIQTAISKRGVSVIVLPGDVALKDAVIKEPRVRFHDPKSALCPSDEELNVLAELLNRSEKITILGGAGCAGTHAELIEVAGKLQAPIVHALRGKEFLVAITTCSTCTHNTFSSQVGSRPWIAPR
jgi:pyruvate dehydrogenase (quinone)